MIRAFFGGTFDPIHNGHLETSSALMKELGIDRLAFMPSAIPPHRTQPEASAEQRLNMVKLACKDYPGFEAEDWELQQSRPSYTTATLAEFSERFPNDTLVFVMGMDSLMSLNRWHKWREIVQYAHIVVMPRSGVPFAPQGGELETFIAQHRVNQPSDLESAKNGKLYIAQTPLIDISATELREQLHKRPASPPIPESVYKYIKENKLYL